MPYLPGDKQGEAWTLLREGPCNNVLLVGGSRSGKTSVIVEEILCRALMFPGSRHLIARLRFAHAKNSLWMDTIPKIIQMEGLERNKFKWSATDHYIICPNGSEIWVDGLDDKDRVDKILGREYCTIFFNECSEITYDAESTVLTRLAQNVPGCQNKAFADLNPVGKLHWAYKLFIRKVYPISDEPVPNPEDYGALYLQPDDNIVNLPPGYIERVLDALPEHKRRRFRLGQWGEPEGVVFPNWTIVEEVPEEVKRRGKRSHGLDFGFSVDPTSLTDIFLYGDDIYLDELIYAPGLTNKAIAKAMRPFNLPERIYADSAEPKSIKELEDEGFNIVGAAKGQDSVRQGIDWLSSKNIHVTRRSYNIQDELQNYVWLIDRSGRTQAKPVDDYNHAIDSARYGCEKFMRAPAKMTTSKIKGLI